MAIYTRSYSVYYHIYANSVQSATSRRCLRANVFGVVYSLLRLVYVSYIQRLCSRLTALWRYINFVLLLLLLLFYNLQYNRRFRSSLSDSVQEVLRL